MRRSVHTLAIMGLCNFASEFSWFCDACDRVGLNSTLSRHRSVQVVMDSRPGTEFSLGVKYFSLLMCWDTNESLVSPVGFF